MEQPPCAAQVPAVSPRPPRPISHAESLLAPLYACARGEVAPNVALAQVVMRAETRTAVEAALAAAQQEIRSPASAAARTGAAAALWRATPGAWDAVKQVLSAADHDAPARGAADWAARFDAAAAVSPEAGVALYSLGRADLADAAARSIVGRMQAWGLTGRDRSAIDLGCGSGRLLLALAPYMGRVVGADVSAGMLKAAGRRCSGLANVSLARTSGEGLAAFADGDFDLVAAVDVFPYLVRCPGDLALRHMLDAYRVLAPGGSLLILNYAYGMDAASESAEVTACAERAGLRLARQGRNDFDLWDGRTFHFLRPMR